MVTDAVGRRELATSSVEKGRLNAMAEPWLPPDAERAFGQNGWPNSCTLEVAEQQRREQTTSASRRDQEKAFGTVFDAGAIGSVVLPA